MTSISVIVPAHNVEPYISRCLDSLLAQTVRDFEIILVDDGATDRTGAIADRYAARDHRVRVVHRVNGGLSAARNSGLDIATGELVSLVDGDDWVDPQMLERMAARMEESGADIVIAGMHVDHHDANERLLSSREERPPDLVVSPDRPISGGLVDDTLVNLLGYAWNKMYRREFIVSNALRFMEGVSLVEDTLFNAEALTRADSVALLDDAFVHYVQRPRVTLGTKTYRDLLALRLRAVEAVDKSLTALGADNDTRLAVAALKSQVTLVMAVRSAARQEGSLNRKAEALRNMVASEAATALDRLAQARPPRRCRDAITLTLLRNGHLRAALLPMRAVLAVEAVRLARRTRGANITARKRSRRSSDKEPGRSARTTPHG